MNTFLDAMFAETHSDRILNLRGRVEEEEAAFHIRCLQNDTLPPEKAKSDSIGSGIALGCFWLGLFGWWSALAFTTVLK